MSLCLSPINNSALNPAQITAAVRNPAPIYPPQVVIEKIDQSKKSVYNSLSGKVQRLDQLQSKLLNATTHETRNKIISCLALAVWVSAAALIAVGMAATIPSLILPGVAVIHVLGIVCDFLRSALDSNSRMDDYTAFDFIGGFSALNLADELLTNKRNQTQGVAKKKNEIKQNYSELANYFKENKDTLRANFQKLFNESTQALEQIGNPETSEMNVFQKSLNSTRSKAREALEWFDNQFETYIQALETKSSAL